MVCRRACTELKWLARLASASRSSTSAAFGGASGASCAGWPALGHAAGACAAAGCPAVALSWPAALPSTASSGLHHLHAAAHPGREQWRRQPDMPEAGLPWRTTKPCLGHRQVCVASACCDEGTSAPFVAVVQAGSPSGADSSSCQRIPPIPASTSSLQAWQHSATACLRQKQRTALYSTLAQHSTLFMLQTDFLLPDK